MNIIVSDLTGSGKTAHAHRVADVLGYEYISGSKIRAAMTLPAANTPDRDFWLFSEKAIEADRTRLLEPNQDAEVDATLSALNTNRDRLVFDAWFLSGVTSGTALSIYLDVDLDVRVHRISIERGEAPSSELKAAIHRKDEQSRAYAQLRYGKDITSDWQPFEVIVRIQTHIDFDTVSSALVSIAKTASGVPQTRA